MPRVMQLQLHDDPLRRRPATLLEDWPTMRQLARSAAAAGAEVRVVSVCEVAEQHRVDGVDYLFLPRAALAQQLQAWRPQLLHVQGLAQGLALPPLLDRWPELPVLLQDRADRPPRPWRWLAWRRALARARGVMFCDAGQAAPWRRRGLLAPGAQVYELPGSSSDFGPQPRDAARARCGMTGEPALLWVGHLDANKDPLTVLDGLARAAPYLPDLQLWCCYGSNALVPEMRARVAADPRLRGRVHWLGRVPHGQVETLMAAADALVQGSHREATGFTVLEALACALPPLVTDIPAFRALLGAPAEAGRLWRVGHGEGLAQALLSLMREPEAARRAAARQRFEHCLSPTAWGQRLVAIYEDALRP
ncbi:MAG: glycosyl transferase [Roseateles depolymerans]|uniref:Glycosyl transferase n=1 Tax=Roseateles depolymerans TaxID=76731 RepID=A0A2W5FN46_9BURK|nr:MAG: glycosyl transferase [Roseateles depolymerans]